MGRLMTLENIPGTIEDHDEFILCYNEFKTNYKKNPQSVTRLKEILETLETKQSYPFAIFQAIGNILPNDFGELGTKYIVHVLRHGIVNEDYEDNSEEVDQEIFLELSCLVNRYGVLYMCAEKLITNPMDFTTTQMIHTSESEKNFIRFVRADQSALEFNIDVDTMVLMAKDMIEKINTVIRMKGHIPQHYNTELFASAYDFGVLTGEIPSDEVATDADDQ